MFYGSPTNFAARLMAGGWFALSACGPAIETGWAHDQNHPASPPAAKPADIYRPGLLPDRINLTWTADPKTTQAVTWRTSTEIRIGIAQIAEAEAGPDFPEDARQQLAQTQVLVTDINDAHFHTVEWQDLKPGTKYAYRVGDGTNWSEWFHFSTATETTEPFSFIYFGDAQNDIRSLWSRVIREAYSDAPKARFMIHAGDLINRAESDAEWGEWFGAGQWLNAMIPSLPIPGNHEQAKVDDQSRLSRHWRPQFALPTNGPESLQETCYTLVYQNMRIIGLNSNEQIELQSRWLDSVLAANRSQWVVCTFHHPIFSTGKDRDNPQLRSAWKPIFDKYKVDLVLQGHDHTYGRTGLDVPADPSNFEEASSGASAVTISENVGTGIQQHDSQTGTIYVVSVSGPKMYNNTRYTFMQRLAEDTQLYQIIRVDGDRLRYESRTAIGQLYDAFELVKRPGQINQLVEVEPEVPQRLRRLPVETNTSSSSDSTSSAAGGR